MQCPWWDQDRARGGTAQTQGTKLCCAIKIIHTLSSQALALGGWINGICHWVKVSCSLYCCHPFGCSSSLSSLCGCWSCDKHIWWLDSEPTGASTKPPLDLNRLWDGLLAPGLDVVPRTAPVVLTHIQPYAFPIWVSAGSYQGWPVSEGWLLGICWQ